MKLFSDERQQGWIDISRIIKRHGWENPVTDETRSILKDILNEIDKLKEQNKDGTE